MIIETLSTFPRMYDSVMGSSIMQRAQNKGIVEFHAHDLRDWTHDRHRTTDDDPYGGGAGLVMKCEPIVEALEDILGIEVESLASPTKRTPLDPTIVLMAPHGRLFDDSCAADLAACNRLMFICGHYEGVDGRIDNVADEVLSIGDYVLTSGELASMVVIDAVVRKLPGVLGAEEGSLEESFVDGLLEYPQYTRPADVRGAAVPDVLLSGDHGAVARWRREQSLLRTYRLRPDMIAKLDEAGALSSDDRIFLESLADDQGDLPEAVS